MEKRCVLIPSYNEAKTIGPIIRKLKALGLSVYVVDDGSTDGSAAIAEAEGATVIRNKRNLGKGAALREGFGRILADGYDICILMDGDGQHKTEDIPSFLEKMRQSDADMVIGNRMSDTSSMPHVRVQTNRFMSNILSRVSGQYVPDSQCGFRLIKRKVLEKMELESSNYEIESEMIIEAARADFKIESVPVRTVYEDQKSKINPVLDTVRFIILMAKKRLKRETPPRQNCSSDRKG